MKSSLRKFLWVLNTVSYGIGLYETFILKHITLGGLITLASCILTVILYFLEHQDTVRRFLTKIFSLQGTGSPARKFFTCITIGYVAFWLLALLLMLVTDYYKGGFILIWILPIIYSLLVAFTRVFKEPDLSFIAAMHQVIALIPTAIVCVAAVIIQIDLWWLYLILFLPGFLLVGFPVILVTTFTLKILDL